MERTGEVKQVNLLSGPPDGSKVETVQSDGHESSGLKGVPKNVEVAFDQVPGIPEDMVGPIRWDHPQAAHLKIISRDEGILEPRTRKKVCIVGYAENSRHLAWFNDPDCEIWGVNQLYRFIPRADRWFQIHYNWMDERMWAVGTNLHEFLKECQIPVYMIKPEPDIPMSVAYPIDRVMKALDTHRYFTSTIAFMVSLAIEEGFEEIGIYGIDLIIGREYFYEKACVEYYLGIANARGIKIHLPEGCALLWQPFTYGFEVEPDYGFYGLSKLEARRAQLSDQVKEKRDAAHVAKGRLDEAQEFFDKMTPESKEKTQSHLTDLTMKFNSALNQLQLHEGALQEVSRMHDILELKTRGAQVK